jgi:hypothetical protein
MPSQFPDAIHVVVSAQTLPLPGLLVLTRIVMQELNDYWGVFGPTDGQGMLSIKRNELLASAHATQAFLPEEFADPLTHGAGLIEVRILDEVGIGRAIEAAAISDGYPYPPGYVQLLREGQARLIELGRVLMEVAVMVEGGNTDVKAKPPL